MKIRPRRGEPLHHDGVEYVPDEEGYCEVPEIVAYRAGWAKRKDPEVSKAPVENSEKQALVAHAAELGVGAPSTLKRWGEERLRDAIAEAESAQDESDTDEDDKTEEEDEE